MPPPPRTPRLLHVSSCATFVLLLLVAAACSGAGSDGASDGAAAADRSTTTTAASPTTTWTRPDCDLGATREVPPSEPVAGVTTDVTLTSFDGTKIRLHWLPTAAAGDEPAPTVLMGPGWGQAGDTSLEGAALFGALDIGGLNAAGYHVLTWDPRGFGQSTGVVTVNSPDHEGRDAQALLDWVAARPEAQLDGPGDPRVGMVGWSYGGGIQLTLAGIDCRVDALVPGLAWHSLTTSLHRAETVKTGWAGILADVAIGKQLDPHIASAQRAGVDSGVLSDEDRTWFAERGPGDLVERIDVPTLFVQGTVDTLFTLDEAVVNHRVLVERGVPTAMLWFCGGHGSCLTEPGDPDRVARGTRAWLDRYLRDDESVEVGAVLDLVDQDGVRWTADRYPGADDGGDAAASGGSDVGGSGSGTLDLAADPQPAPFTPPAGRSDVLTALVAAITPTRAGHAVEVPVDPGEVDGLALGAPTVRLAYSGTVSGGERPTRVFAQLVDDTTGVVLGNQVTPIAVELDGDRHQASVSLEVVAHHVSSGHGVTLQLIAATPAYAATNRAGSITFHDVEVFLPLPSGVRRAG